MRRRIGISVPMYKNYTMRHFSIPIHCYDVFYFITRAQIKGKQPSPQTAG